MYWTFLQQFPKPTASFLASDCYILVRKDKLRMMHLRKWGLLWSFAQAIAQSCSQHNLSTQGDWNTVSQPATCSFLPTWDADVHLQNPIPFLFLHFLPPFTEQLCLKQGRGFPALPSVLRDSWLLCKVGVPPRSSASAVSWQSMGGHQRDSQGGKGSSPQPVVGQMGQTTHFGGPVACLTWRCSAFVASKYFCQSWVIWCTRGSY